MYIINHSTREGGENQLTGNEAEGMCFSQSGGDTSHLSAMSRREGEGGKHSQRKSRKEQTGTAISDKSVQSRAEEILEKI